MYIVVLQLDGQEGRQTDRQTDTYIYNPIHADTLLHMAHAHQNYVHTYIQ